MRILTVQKPLNKNTQNSRNDLFQIDLDVENVLLVWGNF